MRFSQFHSFAFAALMLTAIVTTAQTFSQRQATAQEPAAVPNDPGEDFKLEPGFESLFNGKDLTGWNILPTTEQQKQQHANWKKNDPHAPPWPIYTETIDFAGKTKSDDGRFVAVAGNLVVTVPPEGRKIQMLFTSREFSDDFTLKLEFRAAPNADSGVFIRGKQLQCRDYPNAGPYKELKNFKPGDWNEIVVVVKGETAHCTCNGELLEDAMQVPASGPIGVEGDQGQLEYRRIRVHTGKLKPTNKTDSWTFELTGEGKGTIKQDGEAITFTTTQTGDENWHVQAYQAGLDLEDGADYTIRFEMKASDAPTVLLSAMINQEDWHEVGLHEDIYPGKEFKQYTYTFTATDVVAGNNRIGFALGQDLGSVTVKDLTLSKK